MQEQRASLSVVLMGGSGTGKSTLAGHLAVKAGAVPAREAEKMEKECVAAGAGREKRFAWLLDRSQQVRRWFFSCPFDGCDRSGPGGRR